MAKISGFADAFPGATLNSSNWYVEPDAGNGQPSGPVTVSGGTLALGGGTYSDAGYYTSVNSQAAWDLTGSAVFIGVTPGGSGTGDGDSGIAVLAANFSDGYNFDVTGGNLQVQRTVGDSPTVLHSAAYSAAAMAWLRIREASGTIYFEYAAAANGTYTAFYSTTTETVGSWSAAASYVQLFYGSDSGNSSPSGTAGFRDLNVVPGGFAAVGSAITPAVSGKTFTLAPHAVGDVILIEVISATAADYATALSSSNVAWDPAPLVAHTALAANSVAATVFKGQVTAATSSTVTITTAAGSPTLRAAGIELSAAGGYAGVALDASGTVSAATALCPALTPGRGAGEAYFCFVFDAGSSTAGSTSGYTYGADANGNGLCYNAACASGTQQPAFGASDTISGIAVLLYQAGPSGFAQPGAVPSRHPAARKGTAKGSPGAPWTAFTPPSGSPVQDTAGQTIQDTAGQPVEDTLASTAPFAQPGRAAAGKASARKGAQAGSAGAPYVYVPVIPAVFTQPDKAVPGRPAARKGAAEGSPGAPVRPQPAVFAQPHRGVSGAAGRRAPAAKGSPGAPWTLRLPAAPFAQPNRAAAGRRAARKGKAAGSPARVYSPLAQAVSGSTTGTTLTLTFPAPVNAGNAVIVCVAGYYDGTVTGMTLGTSGGTFTHVGGSGGTGGNNAGIYANLSAAQSSPTLVITTSAAGIIAYAYEVTGGTVFFDVLQGSTGTGTSWSSGTTAATVPYPHFIVGVGAVIANTGSITATASGWANEPAITNVAGAGGHAIGAVSGWRQAPSSGTYAYSGTSGTSSAWGGAVAAFTVVPGAGNTWGGYIFTEHPSYTGVTATFSLPSSMPANPNGNICSVWIGLGNVYQTGVYLSSNTGFAGNVSTSPWSWWFGGGGGAGELWSASAYPTGAGDSLSLSLTVDGSYWYATMANNTRGWSYTEVKSVLGLNASTWGYDGTTGAPTGWGWIYPVPNAEVVIEQEGGPPNQLPDYGTITFTSVTTTPAIVRDPAVQFTVPTATTGITQYPGPFDHATGSYTMYWNHA